MRNALLVTLYIIFAVCVTVSFCGCVCGHAERLLTEQQITEIANSKAVSEGIPPEESNIYYDVGNKDWSETLASLRKNSPDYVKERGDFDELRGHDYQTIIYTPKNPDTLGGVLFVFIDRVTGKVITIHGEE